MKQENDYIYVLSISGEPLMPTKHRGKVTHLLKQHKAKILNYHPFTIQLLYETKNYTQPITLGVDAGTKHIGLSASTVFAVLFAAEYILRTDIVNLLSTRRECRRTRRNRLRYRQPRFNNRVASKKPGWITPSIQNKIQAYLSAIKFVASILPISSINVEVAQFDTQKLKNPEISGIEYQQGEQVDSYNVREYVLTRDNYVCQHCKGKTKDNILIVHHIESRKIGGNAPNNLVVLCKACHDKYHSGKLKLNLKRSFKSLRDAACMSIMRWKVFELIRDEFKNIPVHSTYGYITKFYRIKNKIPKSHINDAKVISRNFDAVDNKYTYKMYQRRRHNRQIYKMKILKNGKLKRNQTDYKMFGFCLFDIVEYDNQLWFISGRRSRGWFCLKNKNNDKLEVNYKKLKLISNKNIL